MIGGWIAFVFGKSVGRVFQIQFDHRAIPLDLGDNAGSGNAETDPVASDQRGLWAGKIRNRQAVDERVDRLRCQREKGPSHRPVCGPEDVPPVDLKTVQMGRCPADPGIRDEEAVKFLPFGGGQFFGIIQSRQAEVWRKHDSGGNHGTGQRPTTGFVNARNGKNSAGDEKAFLLERAGHFQARSAFSFTVVADLPLRSRRKFSFERRTAPWRSISIFAMRGEWRGNTRSTPSP